MAHPSNNLSWQKDSTRKQSRPKNSQLLIVRPMLLVSREEVMLFVSERGIPYVEDSTNSLDIYTRNKIRSSVLPVIKEINPKFHEAAASAAAILRADEEFLSKLADEYIAEHAVPVSYAQTQINIIRPFDSSTHGGRPRAAAPTQTSAVCDISYSNLIAKSSLPDHCSLACEAHGLAQLPFAISGRVIRKLYGGNLSLSHVDSVLELCKSSDPSARLSLPGKTVYREYDRVVFGGKDEISAGGFPAVYPEDGDILTIPGLNLKLTCNTIIVNDIISQLTTKGNCKTTSFVFKHIDICGRITVRPRLEGDSIRLIGRKGTKTLKKLFIEHRIPRRQRNLIPVVADDIGVLAVYGVGATDRAVPGVGDRAVRIDFDLQVTGNR